MSLHRLHIEGYRSLKDVTWEPGNLNILIGPNGAGKSNLLRSLSMLHAMGNGQLREFVLGDGGMAALLCQKSEETELLWQINLAPQEPGEWELRHLSCLRQLPGTSDYEIWKERIEFVSGQRAFGVEASPAAFSASAKQREKATGRETWWWADHAWLLTEEGGVGHQRLADRCLSDLASWRIHGDVNVASTSKLREPPQSRIEYQLDSDGQNLITVLHTLYTADDTFREQIDSGMRAAFGEDYLSLVFPPDPGHGRVQMGLRWSAIRKPLPASSLSQGTLYFLFLLTALANPTPPALIAIDEPELHLHPGMLPLIAEYAVAAASRSQVIFATQSPDFLDCFTEEKVTTTVVTCEDGETKLRNIGGPELDRFLKEFRLGELFRDGTLEQWEEPTGDIGDEARRRIEKLSQEEGGE